MRMSPDWESHAQNWAEDPEMGLEMAVDSFIQYNDNPHEQFLQVWYDFFRYDAVDYVRGMVSLGYDAVYVDKEYVPEGQDRPVVHAIVLNPGIIDVKSVKDISNELSEETVNRLQVLAGIKKKKDD